MTLNLSGNFSLERTLNAVYLKDDNEALREGFLQNESAELRGTNGLLPVGQGCDRHTRPLGCGLGAGFNGSFQVKFKVEEYDAPRHGQDFKEASWNLGGTQPDKEVYKECGKGLPVALTEALCY